MMTMMNNMVMLALINISFNMNMTERMLNSPSLKGNLIRFNIIMSILVNMKRDLTQSVMCTAAVHRRFLQLADKVRVIEHNPDMRANEVLDWMMTHLELDIEKEVREKDGKTS